MSTPTLRELVATHGEDECARLLGTTPVKLRRKLAELADNLKWSNDAAETVARTTIAKSAASRLPALASRAVDLLIADRDGEPKPLPVALADLGHVLGICRYGDSGDTLIVAWTTLATATPTAELPRKRRVDGHAKKGTMSQACLAVLEALGDDEMTSADLAAKMGADDARATNAICGTLVRYGYIESLGGGVLKRTDKAVPS